MPTAEIGTAQQENPVTLATGIELDSNGTYVLPLLGKLVPVDLDTHVMSFYIHTEDPAFDDLERIIAEDAHLYG